MSNFWLFKTEPRSYSYDQLERDGSAVWDGVRNNLALMHLRAMKSSDRVMIYHSGAVKEIVGLARLTSKAYPDPKLTDPKLVVVDLSPIGRLPKPIPLAEVKGEPALQDLALVRMTRLSVMPVTAAQWERLLAMSGSTQAKPA
ncbi:MAG: EVE domain-containing protein [Gemmatimonadota bacterium]